MNKFVLPVFFLLSTVACHVGASESRPLVVASIRPMALMVGDLAGDWLEVETLLGANQEPHHVSLSIAQRKKILDADLVVWVGPELETFLAKVLGQGDMKKVLSFHQTLGSATAGVQHQDFHYWLHPQLAISFYQALAQQLGGLFPERAMSIQARLAEHLADLSVQVDRLRGELAPYRNRRLIVDHQAYSYFADFFHLRIAGALVDESRVAVGPRSMAALVELTDVSCVAVESMPPSRRATKIAASLNIPVVEINPLGRSVSAKQGYLGLLASVANGFRKCFNAN